MNLRVRVSGPDHHAVWADMPQALWPETADDPPLREIAATAGPGIGAPCACRAEDGGGAPGFFRRAFG